MSHEHAVTLLGAYADDELPPETRREVEAHLAECTRCVQELRVQTALRHRLRAEESALEPSDALMRLEALRGASRAGCIGATGVGRGYRPGKRSVLRHPLVGLERLAGRGEPGRRLGAGTSSALGAGHGGECRWVP